MPCEVVGEGAMVPHHGYGALHAGRLRFSRATRIRWSPVEANALDFAPFRETPTMEEGPARIGGLRSGCEPQDPWRG